jgi:hypothetical protein
VENGPLAIVVISGNGEPAHLAGSSDRVPSDRCQVGPCTEAALLADGGKILQCKAVTRASKCLIVEIGAFVQNCTFMTTSLVACLTYLVYWCCLLACPSHQAELRRAGGGGGRNARL